MKTQYQIKVASMSLNNLSNLSSEIGWLDIRVDRATALGNPFEIPKNCSAELQKDYRKRVILAFRSWLWENIQLNQSNPNERISLNKWIETGYIISKQFKNPTAGQIVRKLRELWGLLSTGNKIRLLCWCAPLDCHADVIKSCLLKAENNPEFLALICSKN
jgi:hypothetical protein